MTPVERWLYIYLILNALVLVLAFKRAMNEGDAK